MTWAGEREQERDTLWAWLVQAALRWAAPAPAPAPAGGAAGASATVWHGARAGWDGAARKAGQATRRPHWHQASGAWFCLPRHSSPLAGWCRQQLAMAAGCARTACGLGHGCLAPDSGCSMLRALCRFVPTPSKGGARIVSRRSTTTFVCMKLQFANTRVPPPPPPHLPPRASLAPPLFANGSTGSMWLDVAGSQSRNRGNGTARVRRWWGATHRRHGNGSPVSQDRPRSELLSQSTGKEPCPQPQRARARHDDWLGREPHSSLVQTLARTAKAPLQQAGASQLQVGTAGPRVTPLGARPLTPAPFLPRPCRPGMSTEATAFVERSLPVCLPTTRFPRSFWRKVSFSLYSSVDSDKCDHMEAWALLQAPPEAVDGFARGALPPRHLPPQLMRSSAAASSSSSSSSNRVTAGAP